MNPETAISECEHEWEEYDDPAAYNDGFNGPVEAVCKKCGAREDIRHKYAGINKLKWYENLLLIPFSLVVILYLITIGPIIMIIAGIRDEITSNRKAR